MLIGEQALSFIYFRNDVFQTDYNYARRIALPEIFPVLVIEKYHISVNDDARFLIRDNELIKNI